MNTSTPTPDPFGAPLERPEPVRARSDRTTDGYVIAWSDGITTRTETLDHYRPWMAADARTAETAPCHEIRAELLALEAERRRINLDGPPARGFTEWQIRQRELDHQVDNGYRIYIYAAILNALADHGGGGILLPGQSVDHPTDIELADGIIVSGDPTAPTLIVGAPKTGKSTTARWIAAALAARGHGVAVVALEDLVGWDRVHGAYPVDRQWIRIAGITRNPIQQHRIEDALDAHDVRYVILDPLAKWMAHHGLTETVPRHMIDAINALRDTYGHDRHFIVCHHTTNAGKTARGSNALTGEAGVTMTTGKAPGGITVTVTDWRHGDTTTTRTGHLAIRPDKTIGHTPNP